jgi:hypothetical protein
MLTSVETQRSNMLQLLLHVKCVIFLNFTEIFRRDSTKRYANVVNKFVLTQRTGQFPQSVFVSSKIEYDPSLMLSLGFIC